MIADLHCHSTASDGALPPATVLRDARAAGVSMLSITDHDTVAAYAQLADADVAGIELIPGIEFSAQWRNRGIHVVGLNIDPGHRELAAAIGRQANARHERAGIIAGRLQSAGIEGALDGARREAGNRPVGRPDFAAFLVANGHARSVSAAFRKYLGAGRPGDVRSVWPELETVCGWIRTAGGVAVLAHPAKYRMTNARTAVLAGEFRDAGGHAIEVISGWQTPDITARFTRLCERTGLHASCGSDFHAPGAAWSALGCAGQLPAGCRPVWELF